MLERIWRFLQGYLDVVLSGTRPEQILNLAAAERLELWHIRHRPGRLLARLKLADLRRARTLAQRAGLRLRLERRAGWPLLWRRLRRRRGLLAGAVLAAALLLFLAGHVWVVQVRGAAAVDARAVLKVAAGLGLRPGVWRGRLDVAAVERGLPERIPQLAWVGISLHGTRAVIQVVERHTVLPPQPVQRVDLVAGRACQVARIVPLAGHALVKEGEVVQPGQVLIEGVQKVRESAAKNPGEPPPEPDIPLRDVRARGIIQAHCWYQAYYELPRVLVSESLTGKRSRRLSLRWLGKDILGFGKPGGYAHQRVGGWRLALPWWRNSRPLVEIQFVTSAEIAVHEEKVATATLLARARQRLADVLHWQLAPGDRIERLDASLIQEQPAAAGIRATAQVLQEIGRPMAPPVTQGGLPKDWSSKTDR